MTVLEPVVQFIQDYGRNTVTIDQVIEGAERPRRPVLRVMDRLVREGYLEEIEDNRIPLAYGEVGCPRRNPTWRIVSKPLAEIARPRPKRRTLRDQLWSLIRARRRFTRSELHRLSGVSKSSSDEYTKLLHRHGYLREIGKDGGEKVFMLIKDPGPARPILKEKIEEGGDE